jgi:hypothetical protein
MTITSTPTSTCTDEQLIEDEAALAAELARLARKTALARARADLAHEQTRESACRALQRAFNNDETEDPLRKAANDFLKLARPDPPEPSQSPATSASPEPASTARPPTKPSTTPTPPDPDTAHDILERLFHTNTPRAAPDHGETARAASPSTLGPDA